MNFGYFRKNSINTQVPLTFCTIGDLSFYVTESVTANVSMT